RKRCSEMSNENFRRQVNDAIDQISGSPSPALRDRVRSSLTSAPATSGSYWIAAVAAVEIAVLLVGVLVVANPLNRRPPVGTVAGPTPTPTPSTPGPSPTHSPDQPATVQGANGLQVTIRGTPLNTDYAGSLDIKTRYTGLVEISRVQDFEGVVQLGLGISGPGCYRWFLLANPDRLVIDVQTSQ